jgi:signal transduction histidine kinase
VGAVKRFTHLDQPLVSEPLELEPGIRDAVTMLAARIREKGITLTLDVAPGTPRARVTPEINQVWTNLIDNALYAAPPNGHVKIRVRPEQTWIAVDVVDDGPGIPPDVGPRVFDPFFTTKPVGSGTGLGLDISRRILRQWGGEVGFVSKPGATEFTVRLPAERGSA